jgi:hypothetical protein
MGVKISRALVLLVALSFSCRGARLDRQIEELRLLQEGHDANLADSERAVLALSTEWQDIVALYRIAQQEALNAKSSPDVAAGIFGANAEKFREAEASWAVAEERWKWVRALVVVAAQIDAANLDIARGARPSDLASCERVSTAAHRRHLLAAGQDVEGMDVDHIVPKSLGGADHPLNYQLLDSSVNRSIGNEWGISKCISVGVMRCAGAVLVSRRCGSFTGPLL